MADCPGGGHFVAHDYAKDVVKAYFNHVTDDVDQQWKLYETLCCGHMSMSDMEKIKNT